MQLHTEKLIGFAAAIADGGGVVAAKGGSNGVDAEATLAAQFLVLGNLREGREHQQLAGDAGVEVGAVGFEVGPESSRHDCDEREPRFANGASHGLLARRNATRDDDAAAIGEEKRVVDLCVDFGLCGAARDLNEKLVGQFCEKGVADGVAGWGKSGGERRAERAWQDPSGRAWQGPSRRAFVGSGRALAERTQRCKVDRSRHFEEIVVLHDGPAALGVAQDIASHAFELAFAEENRVVEAWKPEGRRTVDDMGRRQGEIGFCAGDLEASNDFTERRSERLVNPDDAMEMLGHDGELTGLDFWENSAEVLPGFNHRAAERGGDEVAVANLTQNRTAALHREGDHIEPRFAVIPTRQTDASLEMAVLVAFAKVGAVHGLVSSEFINGAILLKSVSVCRRRASQCLCDSSYVSGGFFLKSQVGVGSGVGKRQDENIILVVVEQYPVAFNMAIAQTNHVADERMIFILGRKRFAASQHIDDSRQFCALFLALHDLLQTLFEARCLSYRIFEAHEKRNSSSLSGSVQDGALGSFATALASSYAAMIRALLLILPSLNGISPQARHFLKKQVTAVVMFMPISSKNSSASAFSSLSRRIVKEVVISNSLFRDDFENSLIKSACVVNTSACGLVVS